MIHTSWAIFKNESAKMKTIKDFIYFDYEKAKSLQSQLGGGLLNEITRAFENEIYFEFFEVELVPGLK